MATFGVFPLLMIIFFSGSSSDDLPSDVLGLLDPEMGLSLLERKADADALERLIAPPAGEGGEAVLRIPQDEVQRAIDNLASSTEALRVKAREKLVEAGPAVRKRLEEVVSKDARRAEEARKVLALLEGREGAAAHEDDIARTLAIRLAARKKMTALMPAIRKAVASKNPFVRMAAEDALIRLGDKAGPGGDAASGTRTVVASPGPGLKEVEALPAETRLLVSVRLNLPEPGAGKGLTIGEFMQKMAGSMPISPGDIEEAVDEGSKEMLAWVRTYGNMRPEHVYVANVGSVDEQGGGLGIVIQGLYQPGVLRQALGQSPMWTSSEVAGVTVYNAPFLRVALLSDRSVLLLPVMASLRFPLEDYLKNLAAGKNALAGKERLSQFLAALKGNEKELVRGLAITDETLMSALHQEIQNDPGTPAEVAKAVKALSEVELTVTPIADEKTRVRFEGIFGSPEDSRALTEFLEQQIKATIGEMEQMMQQIQIPVLQTMVDILKAIKLSAEGKRGILRLEMPALKLEEVFGATFGAVQVR
jgi:hypothetical protein